MAEPRHIKSKQAKPRHIRGWLMTHRGTTKNMQGGRCRTSLRLNGSKRWWVSTHNVRYNVSNGYCKAYNRWLLLDTVQPIPHPTGVYEEFDYNASDRRGSFGWKNSRRYTGTGKGDG